MRATGAGKECDYSRHEESNAVVRGSAGDVFARLDDQTRLSAHMSKRSWKMGWGKMETVLDSQRGHSVGSHIVLSGRVFGLRLYLDEVVTVREEPFHKTWQTTGSPKLLVIGRYQMGFDLTPDGLFTRIRVAIDYELPPIGFARLLGRLFGQWYAKWCTRQMILAALRS